MHGRKRYEVANRFASLGAPSRETLPPRSHCRRLARIARSYRDWGRDCYCAGGESNTCGTRFSQQFGTLPAGYDHKYVYSHVGYNLKVTDMQAAIGCAQCGTEQAPASSPFCTVCSR